MMTDTLKPLDRFFNDAANRLAVGRALPDGSVVCFELSGDGGGVWTLERTGDRVEVLGASPPVPDCHLRCTARDFQQILTGELDPTTGFMDGRLVIVGDVGIILDMRRAVIELGDVGD